MRLDKLRHDIDNQHYAWIEELSNGKYTAKVYHANDGKQVLFEIRNCDSPKDAIKKINEKWSPLSE